MTDEPTDPYAPPPPGWQPPTPQPAPPPPPYGAPPGWQPQPPPYAAPPGWQPPPPPYGAPPGWQQPQYGAPPGWGPGYQPYGGYPPPSTTNGFAIASLACSIVLSWLFGIGGILGIVFGIIGIKQCAKLNERGRGLAIAGIVIGGIVVALWILGGIGAAVSHSSSDNSNLGALGYSVIVAARSSA